MGEIPWRFKSSRPHQSEIGAYDRRANRERSTSPSIAATPLMVTCPQLSQTTRFNPFVVTSTFDGWTHLSLRPARPKLITISVAPFRPPSSLTSVNDRDPVLDTREGLVRSCQWASYVPRGTPVMILAPLLNVR